MELHDFQYTIKDSQDGFDTCMVRDRDNYDRIVFANNESGGWKILNYKDFNPLTCVHYICTITENFNKSKKYFRNNIQ